jgi:hypothetical protein
MKKNVIKIIAISLVAIMMCCVLASCSGGPQGSYGNDDFTITFSGEKVELTYGDSKKTTVEGTFKMGEDADGNETIIITLPEADSFLDFEYGVIRALLNGEKKYNAGKDNAGNYIEIGGAKYYKK